MSNELTSAAERLRTKAYGECDEDAYQHADDCKLLAYAHLKEIDPTPVTLPLVAWHLKAAGLIKVAADLWQTRGFDVHMTGTYSCLVKFFDEPRRAWTVQTIGELNTALRLAGIEVPDAN